MRAVLLSVAVLAALAMSVTGTAAVPPGSVTGAGTLDLAQAGFSGTYTAALAVIRVPSGGLVGNMTLIVRGTPGIPFGVVQARAKYVESNGNTACVVGEITALNGWYDQPSLLALKVVDVPGGPDRFWPYTFYNSTVDPALVCSFGPEPGFIVATGNFAISR